jgi:uncharacterized protein YcfL
MAEWGDGMFDQMNTTRKIGLFCILAVASAFSGCGSVNSTERAQPTAQKDVVDDKRIVTDAGLFIHIKVVGVNQAVDPSGLTRVQVDLRDDWISSSQFYYKFEWFDAQGILIDTPMTIWTDRMIQAGERMSIVGIGPNPQAKDFRLKLQTSPD